MEIDEADFQRSETLRKTVAKMLEHPSARRKLFEAQKEIDPNVSIPEIDAAKPIQDELAKMGARLDEFQKTAAEEKAEREKNERLQKLNGDFERGRTALRAKGATDEGIKAIEELMEKHGIIDHEVGLAYFEKLHPPATPASPAHSGRWDFFEDAAEQGDEIKKLIEARGESEPLLRKMSDAALNDIRTRR